MLTQKIKEYYINQQGIASIEYALTCFSFFTMLFFILEIARITYISAVLDIAVAEASKYAKNSQGNYQTNFSNQLINRKDKLWHFLSTNNTTKINVFYYASAENFINGQTTENFRHAPLARYHVQYHYQPMFFILPTKLVEGLLTREVAFVQEHERSKFFD